MSMQKPIETKQALPVVATIPTDIYFSQERRSAAAVVKLRALTALEEMYGYYGADLA